MKKFLILGNGGRECAIVRALRNSYHGDIKHNKGYFTKEDIFCSHGNDGTDILGTNVKLNNNEEIIDFAKKNDCIVIPGSETYLVNGIIDDCLKNNIECIGPTKDMAMLEWSKCFTKRTCLRQNIPTSKFEFIVLHEMDDVEGLYDNEYIKKFNYPIVLKCNGLQSGKGVFFCFTPHETIEKMIQLFVNGTENKFIIEEKLEGYELSFMALCDGKNSHILPSSMDHKRKYDGNTGPNTGGMGAVSPHPNFLECLHEKEIKEYKKLFIDPIVKEFNYTGFLYAGLMITKDGPKLLEYNCRLGDPETQAVLPRITDFYQVCKCYLNQQVYNAWIYQDLRYNCCCVVISTKDYAETDNVKKINVKYPQDWVTIALNNKTWLDIASVSNGKGSGRLLSVVSRERECLEDARRTTYLYTNCFHDYHYRKDIGII